jgi:hypothetical protein
MSFDRHPALLKLKSAKVVRGKYMTIDLMAPDRFQPMVAIAFNLSHTPLKRDDAEYLAVAIQRLPDMIEVLTILNQALDGADLDEEQLERLSDQCAKCLEGL